MASAIESEKLIQSRNYESNRLGSKAVAFYTFTIEGFHIGNTRSRFDDTDVVAGVLRLGNETLPVQVRFNGDVDNGDYPIGFVFGPRLISQPDTAVVLSYSIYNGDAAKLPKSLEAMNAELVDKAVDSMIGGKDPEQGDLSDYTNYPGAPDNANFNFQDPSWMKILEYISMASFLFPDCDGFVAVGTIGREKKKWDALIDDAGGDTLLASVQYPGSDSPAGCGSNSDYSVRWSVLRERVSGPGPHSLKKFLSIHQLSARNGLRPLLPGEPMISVMGLMR